MKNFCRGLAFCFCPVGSRCMKRGFWWRKQGAAPSFSAINIENQCFTNQTPDFTPKNVKSGVFIFFKF